MARDAESVAWQAHWQEIISGLVRVHSAGGEQQLIDTLARPAKPLVLAFVNAHAMNSAATSREFFEAVHSADLVLRDGIGMAILLRLLNVEPGLNLNGTDLIPKILRRYAGVWTKKGLPGEQRSYPLGFPDEKITAGLGALLPQRKR